MFYCPLYIQLRLKYEELLDRYGTINRIFNPLNEADAMILGNYILDIEKKRRDLNLE